MTPELTNYRQAEEWLLSITDYERLLSGTSVRYNTRTFDRDYFRSQLHEIDNPHLKYAVIHIAGTKGKGSTCAFLEAALRRCGLRTGLYTSPHLYKFTERIKVNGTDISDEDFCRHIEKLRHVMVPEDDPTHGTADGSRSFRTVFEILTAAAFSHFAEQNVDVAIVETGLGGRLDSTNVFDVPGNGPLVNVITTIGMDHTAILGDSLKAIAGEKAGIIRSHARVVVAPQVNPADERSVADVVRQQCDEVGAAEPVFVAQNLEITEMGKSAGAEHGLEQQICYRLRVTSTELAPRQSKRSLITSVDGAEICPSLAGRHQAANAATAIMALAQLQKAAEQTAPLLVDRLNLDSIIAGIETTIWPGRFQVVDGAVPVVIDGAHCAISAEALARTCRQHFGDRPAIIITGFLQDKAGAEILSSIFSQVPVVYGIAVAPPTPRAVSVDHIRDALLHYLPAANVQSALDLEAAVGYARRVAAEYTDPYIIIFGSLYLVGPATVAASAATKT